MAHVLRVAMIDPLCRDDLFINGLGDVEDVGGGCQRYLFYVRSGGENIVQAKLVAPIEAVPPAVMLAAHAAGMRIIHQGCRPKLLVN